MRDVCALWCCCKSGAETSRLPDVHLEAWCELTHLARLAEGAGITMAAVVPREWLGSVIVRRRAAGVRAKRGARETTAGELCHGASTRGGGQLGEVVAPGAVHGPGAARRLCCGRPQIARCDPARRLVHLEHAREERSTSRARAGAGAGAGASAAGRPHKELHKMAKRGDKRFEFRSGRCSLRPSGVRHDSVGLGEELALRRKGKKGRSCFHRARDGSRQPFWRPRCC